MHSDLIPVIQQCLFGNGSTSVIIEPPIQKRPGQQTGRRHAPTGLHMNEHLRQVRFGLLPGVVREPPPPLRPRFWIAAKIDDHRP